MDFLSWSSFAFVDLCMLNYPCSSVYKANVIMVNTFSDVCLYLIWKNFLRNFDLCTLGILVCCYLSLVLYLYLILVLCYCCSCKWSLRYSFSFNFLERVWETLVVILLYMPCITLLWINLDLIFFWIIFINDSMSLCILD